MSNIVIKVGGALIQNPYADSISDDIARLHQAGHNVLLVHGGGPQLDQAIRQENREPHKIAGRRVTSKADLRLAIRVWRGDISTQWIRSLSLKGVMALALTGQDAQLIQAVKRPKTEIRNDRGIVHTVDFGYVGDIKNVNTHVIEALWQAGIVPVVAPLGAGSDGALLNINADTIATQIAIALCADALVLLSNIDGLLQNPSDPQSRIPHITDRGVQELLRDGTIRTGMRPKVESIVSALRQGVSQVHIANGTKRDTLHRILTKKELV